jgi:two-component system, OmpR family, phosphate regulon sensor histidine kinase PhoR
MKGYIRNPLFLFYLLVIYVVTQFSWWLYLIASLYGKIYQDPTILEKKTTMLVSEGTVFIFIVFGGAFMIRRAYQKESDLNRLQENFLLSVSHELKTPISSITLFLQTLQKHNLDPDKREEIYGQSLAEIKRLESLVSNLLITRSIENRNYYLNKAELKLDELVQNVIDSMKESTLKNHGLNLNLQPVKITGDQEALTSVVTNLLQNAAKYSPAGSEISISLKSENNLAVLEIKDQGIGIAAEKRELVFQRFYRDENEMTRQSKGTGLGLFIVRFLVRQHDGTVELKDNTPKGLHVILTFKN